MKEEKQQVLLIHGGSTYRSYEDYFSDLREKTPNLEWVTSKRDWKNELQIHLGDGFIVYQPQMPNKQNAQYEEWKILFEKLVDLFYNDFILIGHSLGSAFIVKYLSENKISKTIKKTLLLGTPFDKDGMGSEKLNSFLRKKNLKDFEKQAGELYFYHSKDDFAVPFNHIERYEKVLKNAEFRKFEDRNHFLQESVPELVEDIKK